MPTFRLVGEGMADRADTASAHPLSSSKQAIHTHGGQKDETEKFVCAMIT